MAVHGLAPGGVGKTPLSLWIARRLVDRLRGPVAVGTRSPRVVADEITMLSRAGPSVRVFARDDAGRAVRAAARAGCVAVVLDDPSLTRPGAAHLRIACLGPRDGWDVPPLPTGPRRPGSVLPDEIDAIALLDRRDPPSEAAGRLLLRVRTRIAGLRDLASGSRIDRGTGPVWLLCGIARPERVLDALARAGIAVAGHAFLPDHAALPGRVRAATEAAAEAAGAACVVVTAKDAARLPAEFRGARVPWAVTELRLHVSGDLPALWRMLAARAPGAAIMRPAARR